jgi:hypothetical protein
MSRWRGRSRDGSENRPGLPVKRLPSAVAMEAEYTITRPNSSSPSAGHSSRDPAPRLRHPLRAAMRRRRLTSPAASSAHRGGEHLGPMLVVAEHVEAGAGRRQQRRVARLRQRRPQQRTASSMSAAAPVHRHAAAAMASTICSASRPISTRRGNAAGHGVAQRRKILPLPSPPSTITTAFAVLRVPPSPFEAGDRGADVGALRVVVPGDAVDLGTLFRRGAAGP